MPSHGKLAAVRCVFCVNYCDYWYDQDGGMESPHRCPLLPYTRGMSISAT